MVYFMFGVHFVGALSTQREHFCLLRRWHLGNYRALQGGADCCCAAIARSLLGERGGSLATMGDATDLSTKRTVPSSANKSLHQLESSARKTLIILGLLASCTGLLIFSHIGLSAQVASNTPACSPPPPPLTAGRRRLSLVDQCNAADEAQFALMGNRSGDPDDLSQFDSMLSTCGQQCGIQMLSSAACVHACVTDPPFQKFTEDCSSCISAFAFCAAKECTSPCLAGVSAGCLACQEANCADTLGTCMGFDVSTIVVGVAPPPPGATAPFRTLGGKSDISFISGLDSLYSNNAPLLGTVLLVASGIKPYTEIFLLAMIWFMPLPKRSRGQMLRWINRSSRWSLMDNLVIMAMCSAVHFKILGGTISIVAESREAIYTFAIGVLVVTPIGEWMTFRATVHSGFEPDDPAHLGCLGRPLTASVDKAMQRDAKRSRSPFLLLLAPLALVLTAVALFLSDAITWSITEVGTGVEQRYSESLYSLMFAASYPAIDSPAGGIFLGVVYFTIVVFAPLSAGIAMVVIAFIPSDTKPHTLALRWAQFWSPYNSIDVLLIAVVCFASEFNRFIASVSEDVSCTQQASSAIRAEATLGSGFFLAIPAVVLTWGAQVITAVHAATAEGASSKSAMGSLSEVAITNHASTA